MRAEEGCYEYGATVDIESALTHIIGAPRTNTVVIIEKWASIEALQAHIGQPHMKEFKEAIAGLTVSATKLQVLGNV